MVIRTLVVVMGGAPLLRDLPQMGVDVLLADADVPASLLSPLSSHSSFVGGVPHWPPSPAFSPPLPSLCSNCHTPLQLICQVHAPLPPIYDRTLYLFACASVACDARHASWTVYRVQLTKDIVDDRGQAPSQLQSRKDHTASALARLTGFDVPSSTADGWDNPISSLIDVMATESDMCSNDEAWGEDETWGASASQTLMDVDSTLAGLLERRDHTLISASSAKPPTCPMTAAATGGVRHEPSLPALSMIPGGTHLPLIGLTFGWEPERASTVSDADRARVKEYEAQYGPVVGSVTGVGGDGDGEVGWSEDYEACGDKVFRRFIKVVSRWPSQVLRYAFGGDALWCDHGYPDSGAPVSPHSSKPVATPIPPCGMCGSPRVFEMQIMPALVDVLQCRNAMLCVGDDGLDWGVVYVFSCASTCEIASGIVNEYLWVQPSI